MVVREPQPGEPSGYLCIPQAQHAALAGQLARAWGNDAFPAPTPASEVCLAAERHDDGMEPLDFDPELDSDRGLPVDFMHLPLEPWLECWARGPAEVGEGCAYAGVLVSMHGEHLLGYRDLDAAGDSARARAEAWQAEQSELRDRLADRAASEGFERMLEEEPLERARKLLEVWDAMSLAVCMPRIPEQFDGVPSEEPSRMIEMQEIQDGGGPRAISVEPWPFSAPEVPLAVSGRRLAGGYETREELREAWESAAPEVLDVTLSSPDQLADANVGTPGSMV